MSGNKKDSSSRKNANKKKNPQPSLPVLAVQEEQPTSSKSEELKSASNEMEPKTGFDSPSVAEEKSGANETVDDAELDALLDGKVT